MKLKRTEKGQQSKHDSLSRQGKNSKRKGGQYERTIASMFQERYGVELKRTPQSGGFAKKSDKADDVRGDITIVDDKLVEIVRENFDLRPAGIIKMLDLRRPIYRGTAAYGHFGRTDLNLPWEATDKVDVLKKYL